MVIIRNWKDVTPVVAHDNAIVWSIFRAKGSGGQPYEEAPLEGIAGFTFHMVQAGKSSDYHEHDDREQVYYITRGRGKMKIDDRTYDVKQGDAVYVPLHVRHQLINDSDDWIEHLIISGRIKGA